MSDTDAFATIRRARSMRERHADAPPGTVLVALVLATYANGRTGTSIRPGYARVADATGLHIDTVRRAIAWLVERGELRRDKDAHRGSAACFTYTGGMVGDETPPIEKVGRQIGNGVASGPTHQPDQPNPSGLPGPRGNWPACSVDGCERLGDVENWGAHWCEAHAAEKYARMVSTRTA